MKLYCTKQHSAKIYNALIETQKTASQQMNTNKLL